MGRTTCTEPQCLYKGALYLYLYLHTALTRKTNGQSMGTFQNSVLSENSEHWIEKYFQLFSLQTVK